MKINCKVRRSRKLKAVARLKSIRFEIFMKSKTERGIEEKKGKERYKEKRKRKIDIEKKYEDKERQRERMS